MSDSTHRRFTRRPFAANPAGPATARSGGRIGIVKIVAGAILAGVLAGCTTLPKPPRPIAAPTPPAPAAPTVDLAPVIPEPVAPPAPPKPPRHLRFAQQLHEPDCRGVRDADALPFSRRHVRRVMTERAALFNYVVDQIEARQLPGEFAVLPILESGYRPDPGNRGDVRGMWQFSAGTARRFGLRTSLPLDERLSPVLSTRAAVTHLGEMWERWQDWRLALIGYNAGEFTVTLAQRRSGGKQPGWDSPALPKRSQGYARRVHALACMIANDPVVAASLDAAEASALDDRFRAGQFGSLSDLVEHAMLAQGRLLDLNPLLRGTPWSSVVAQPLLLPAALTAPTEGATSIHPAAARTESEEVTEHAVAAGESLWLIARRYGVRVRDLTRWNDLRADQVLRIGQRLRLQP